MLCGVPSSAHCRGALEQPCPAAPHTRTLQPCPAAPHTHTLQTCPAAPHTCTLPACPAAPHFPIPCCTLCCWQTPGLAACAAGNGGMSTAGSIPWQAVCTQRASSQVFKGTFWEVFCGCVRPVQPLLPGTGPPQCCSTWSHAAPAPGQALCRASSPCCSRVLAVSEKFVFSAADRSFSR